MFRKASTSLFTAIAILLIWSTASQAQSQSLMTRHVREVTQTGEAKLIGRLPASQEMRIVLVLPLRHEPELENFIQELYDPSSPSYRQFLTVEEFTERFGPSQEDYDALMRFAGANGLSVVGTSRNRVNLDVKGTVANIEKALHVTMGLYQHPTENRTFYAPDREPKLDLAFPLWRVSGLDNYSIPRPMYSRKSGAESNAKPNASVGSGPGASFLGSDMRAAYYGGSLTGSGQSVGLLEYYGTNLVDLTTYYKNVKQTNNVTVSLVSTDGTSTSCVYPACDDTEQTLDMTQALGMAPGMSSLVVYVGSNDAPIFNSMATASPLNHQLSSSWTWYPPDASTDKPYFLEFAAQGQNLFQAAGDSGAWTATGGGSEIYPADDVYVVSVGGTDLATTKAAGPWKSETSWSDSGGGISPNKFPIPSWQTAAASGCSSCSKSYRNGPDVSANADFTFYVCADQTTCTANEYGGTSFAAPMWAAYLALVNQQAVANGNSPVGFINPTLYTIGAGSSYGTDFHDITSGSNGFSATTGYDLVTGWGSPNGSGLINALAGSSGPGFTISASPTSVSVAQGSSGSSTITSAVTGGFSGSISLSASGQPTGVTVGFNPTSITGAGTSTMTITVASNTATGTYPITVTGTSGSITSQATVTLTVTGTAPSFTVSASPTSITVGRGKTGTSKITTAISGGFNAAITLTAKGQGSLQTVTFSPNPIAAPGSGTATMTVVVGAKATLGNHNITVTAKGGGLTKTTAVTLVVTK